MEDNNQIEGIAIIGMAGRFPQASNVDQFWKNLVDGKDCFTEFSIEHVVSEGISCETAERPDYVKRCPVIADPGAFDNRLFKYSPKEAELIDPQQRIIMECAWEALEHSGHDPHRFPGLIGIWAGVGVNNYFLKNILSRGEFETVTDPQAIISNDKDYMASRIAYKLNLHGPAVVVQTACSTSLVAVNSACLGLLTYQCDMALAGAVFLQTPRARGYLYREGEIFSPDGFVRAFDRDANGTVLGEGCGLVVLRRLEDAIEDHDNILAVIRGFAINNDGADRAGYTAPGVNGQVELISMAQTMAGVSPDDISYIEAHGTGTSLGDPIEVAALTQVFRQSSDDIGFCGLGSVKNNIGHLDVAAGIAGLIKTVCALKHKQIPPTINFTEPNPDLCIPESPFYIVDKLKDWSPRNGRRIAGISSFGMGGTNAHVILEEYTENRILEQSSRRPHIIPLSAATSDALVNMETNFSAAIKNYTDLDLPDIAWTMTNGRQQLNYRSCVVADSIETASVRLSERDGAFLVTGKADTASRPVVFLFSGQGTQYHRMGIELYQTEPVFRESMQKCSQILGPVFKNSSLIDIVYGNDPELGASINQTAVSQVALFAVEYSLARLLEFHGIEPSAVVGHSIGEYVAAYEAGVFSLEDALNLVKERGRLMQSMPSGTMIAIPRSESEVREILPENLDLAVINGPGISVVSGTTQEIEDFEQQLDSRDIKFRRLVTSHAFHSRMMEPAAKSFAEIVKHITPGIPKLPLGSNLTGDWMSPEQISDPEYWSKHLRNTVRFSDNLYSIAKRFNAPVLLEVGPGNTLCSIARQNQEEVSALPAISTIRHPKQNSTDQVFFLRAISALWCNGAEIDFSISYKDEKRKPIVLPSYPFERQHFWINSRILDRETRGVIIEKDETDFADLVGKESEDRSSNYARPDIGVKYAEPTDRVEETLAEIWQDVLGLDKVGINDSFFDLGGNSLIAAQIISRLKERMHISFSIQKIFDRPTIKELAKIINVSEPASPGHTGLRIEKIKKDASFPLSLSQQRLWIIDKIEPYSPAYNIVQAAKITGKLNEDILQKSFDEILKRHEILRTVFKTMEDHGIAELLDIVTFKIQHVEVDTSIPGNGEEKAREWVYKNAPALFDLEKGPLIRAFLFRTAEEEHFFVLIMHHIISDGWSMGVWMNELSVLYAAFEAGESSPLPEVPVQYSDYALWQRKWLEEIDLRGQEEYWKNQLGGKLPVLELPSDYPRPAEASYMGSANFFFLPEQITKELKSLSKKEGISLNIILLSALMVFLSRYSGQKDIIIGSPYANRDVLETERLIGFFLNMLPVRTEISEEESFIQIVKKVRKASFDALENKDLPFEQLVELLKPERSLSYHPLFQVMFAFQNFPIPVIEKSGLTFYPTVFNRGATEYDFALYMWEENETLHGIFEYSLELFREETIVRMTGHFQKLIEGIVASLYEPISRISMLHELEKKQLLLEWNNTNREYPDDKCIHQLFEAQVDKNPDSIAVEFQNDRLTYRELNERINQLANYLKKHGVRPGDYVGVCIERSVNMLVCILAVLKAGGAYVPLDPEYPKERLSYMIETSESKVIITQHKLREELPSTNSTIICIDTDSKKIALENKICLMNSEGSIGATPDDLAYVIFTSGSTGKPKGVQITHRSFINFLKSMEQEPGFTSRDVLLAVTTLSFDIAGLELFLPVISGGKTIIVSRDVSEDGIQLAELLSRSGATVMQATPSTWRILLAAGWKGDKKLKILCGGEAFPKDLAKELVDRSGSVWNMYGPTETTVWSTCHRIKGAGNPIVIGRPIANTKIYVLDKNMQPVPVGVYGELYIGGDGVAKGYLNRPDLTAKQFLPDPFSDGTYAKMYRTGDLGRYHADGNIEYISRIDNQVKVRGFRIELGEIESVLANHISIKECAVVVKEDRPGDARIIAFIVYKPGTEHTVSEVRDFLRQSLPDYMIPNHFVEVDKMPLTPSGKVDRKKLAARDDIHGGMEDKYVAPGDETEEILAGIWQNLLVIDKVGIDDNFFDLGGHSLLLFRMAIELNKVFNTNISIINLFEHPTIREQVNLVCDLKTASSDSETTQDALNEAMIEPFFFGDAQRRLCGIYHQPSGRVGLKKGVVLCYPLPQEYMTSHSSFRLLSKLLSDADFHVLRFDYYGTGDSAGESADVNIDQCISDIITAANELKDRYNVDQLSLVGLRFGAALAFQAAAGNEILFKNLVLWDPVLNGESHITELEGIRDEMRISYMPKLRKQLIGSDYNELLGYPWPSEHRDSVKCTDLFNDSLPSVERIDILASADKDEFKRFNNHLSSSGLTSTYRVVKDINNWGEVTSIVGVQFPSRILHEIVSKLVQEES